MSRQIVHIWDKMAHKPQMFTENCWNSLHSLLDGFLLKIREKLCQFVGHWTFTADARAFGMNANQPTTRPANLPTFPRPPAESRNPKGWRLAHPIPKTNSRTQTLNTSH